MITHVMTLVARYAFFNCFPWAWSYLHTPFVLQGPKTVDSRLKPCVHTKTEIHIHILFVIFLTFFFINLNHCGAFTPTLSINGCRLNHLFAYQYFCPLHYSLDLSMKRAAKKKCNFTNWATLTSFSNNARAITHDARMWLFIAPVPLIHLMQM